MSHSSPCCDCNWHNRSVAVTVSFLSFVLMCPPSYAGIVIPSNAGLPFSVGFQGYLLPFSSESSVLFKGKSALAYPPT